MKRTLSFALLALCLSQSAFARTVDSAAPTKKAALWVAADFPGLNFTKGFIHFTMPEITLAEGESITSATLVIETTQDSGGALTVDAYTSTETSWSYTSTPAATMDAYSLGASPLDSESVDAIASYQFDITGNESEGFKKLFADGVSGFSVVLKDSTNTSTPTVVNDTLSVGRIQVDGHTDIKAFNTDNAYIRVVISESAPIIPPDTTTEENGVKTTPRDSFQTGGSFGF